MSADSRRLDRERRTVAAMIRLYCNHQHGKPGQLCVECTALWDYVQLRLERCPFHENKPTCAKCPIHCYQPVIREQIQAVMRYAGPRMLWRHPILAVRHMMDAARKMKSE
ncbi:MAG: hypothetical protein A2107_11910 [Verrucomicrobia bacterium GWF2_62_7]|nr:MAG: hypothetical protein A2107_11910 [Verrucomicrobia bacterium GWF2_62_7]